MTLFAEKGFAATRMEDVAREAGLSKAGVYLYFKDKLALLTALMDEMAGANIGMASGEFRAVDPAFAAKAMIGPMLPAVIWKTVLEPIGGEPLDREAYAG